MKRLLTLYLVCAVAVVFAQKPVKPNINKAFNSWNYGKYKEAKEIIDVSMTDPKLSLDPKTWLYAGLIYATIDTSSNPAVHNLDPNAFEKARDAFKKADELKGNKSDLFYTNQGGFPVPKTLAIDQLAGYYLNKGAMAYQEDDFKTAIKNFEKSQQLKPDDTTSYFYAGVAANADENYQQARTYMETYLKNGGKMVEAYYVIINAYALNNQKDKAVEVARQAKVKFPRNMEIPKLEIQYLLELNRINEAKAGLQEAIKSEPNNFILHYYLAYTHFQSKEYDEAKASAQRALQIDPKSFDAQILLAKCYYVDAEKIKKEMASLGISEADKKKRYELDKVYVEKLKAALPYWEKAEQLNPSDTEVLDALYLIYVDLGMEAQVKRIEKRYKELGLDN
ncbi:MAG: tetratricopeptide repeat protein [Cyclobacteriaceae bacterium]|nr:tetratricopeptide repeat protein [Cyclobacteriaceae bacterium]MDW8332390.1 tetratricopeptide repeat protein [Cyclobacteriaceae bacterium]